MNKSFIAFIIISAVIAVIFVKFPQIDIWVADLFYNEGDRFYLNTNYSLPGYIHDSIRPFVIFLAFSLISLLISSFITKKVFFGFTRKKIIYLILALAIGPGLIVNTVFKDQWGRARPRQVEEFGGSKTFTPAFIMSDQCERNCSFTSGDPSVGFYFFAFAFAFSDRRKLFYSVAMSSGVIVGMTRVVQGAHFFSDVIFSGVFVFTSCYLLYLLMLKGKEWPAREDSNL